MHAISNTIIYAFKPRLARRDVDGARIHAGNHQPFLPSEVPVILRTLGFSVSLAAYTLGHILWGRVFLNENQTTVECFHSSYRT